MVIIAVSGGKGGTGKSTVAINLAIALASKGLKVVLADLDVECPNDHILLGLKLTNEQPVDIFFPFVDYKICSKCGICRDVCDTGAILLSREGWPFIITRLCNGCKCCYLACPSKAILNGKRRIGNTYLTNYSYDSIRLTLVTGALIEGEEHVPPAVIAAKRRALSINADVYILDTAPGTSNTVSAAIGGSNLIIAVTEPTPLGLHDLRLILRLAKLLKVPVWIVINRFGIGPEEEHVKLAKEFNAKIVARIPYSNYILESYLKGIPILNLYPNSKEAKELIKLTDMILQVSSD